jgi:hypothetical protein
MAAVLLPLALAAIMFGRTKLIWEELADRTVTGDPLIVTWGGGVQPSAGPNRVRIVSGAAVAALNEALLSTPVCPGRPVPLTMKLTGIGYGLLVAPGTTTVIVP